MGRMLVGPDNRVLLPVSALMGALYLLMVDNVSRLLLTVEIPIGILTALLGIPIFAVILKAVRKWHCRPARIQGVSASAWVLLSIQFKLKR